MSIEPHGGVLVDRNLKGKKAEEAKKHSESLPALALSEYELSDLEMIATGALSPLEGFMGRQDYERCLHEKRLESGLPWTIPIVKAIGDDEKREIQNCREVALCDASGRRLAILKVRDVFTHDRKRHAKLVYGTEDSSHPGIQRLTRMGNWLIGGEIFVFGRPIYHDFLRYRLTPSETREAFAKKEWRQIVAFHTRNPLHRAHEHITKSALECVDGLLLHPVVGQTKAGDLPAEVRMKCYQVLLENYYPKDRVMLAVFPGAMRYAGPREAVWHAIIRKNYGCTHFIVGRDHAGAKHKNGAPYYGEYDAHSIFDEFEPCEIGIEIFRFDQVFYDKTSDTMVSDKVSSTHTQSVSISGTRLREMLREGIAPPPEFVRPEVSKILAESFKANLLLGMR